VFAGTPALYIFLFCVSIVCACAYIYGECINVYMSFVCTSGSFNQKSARKFGSFNQKSARLSQWQEQHIHTQGGPLCRGPLCGHLQMDLIEHYTSIRSVCAGDAFAAFHQRRQPLSQRLTVNKARYPRKFLIGGFPPILGINTPCK